MHKAPLALPVVEMNSMTFLCPRFPSAIHCCPADVATLSAGRTLASRRARGKAVASSRLGDMGLSKEEKKEQKAAKKAQKEAEKAAKKAEKKVRA